MRHGIAFIGGFLNQLKLVWGDAEQTCVDAGDAMEISQSLGVAQGGEEQLIESTLHLFAFQLHLAHGNLRFIAVYFGKQLVLFFLFFGGFLVAGKVLVINDVDQLGYYFLWVVAELLRHVA